jgi:type VI protein secretion system component Hcp
MKKIGLLFSLLLCCTLAFSQSIFLDAGPSVPTDEAKGQPVLSFSFGTPDANGDFHDISVTLVTGIMSPELLAAAALGTSFAKMEIKMYDNQNKVYYKITLQDVMVTSFQSGANLNDDVTLSSNKIKIKNFSH